MALRTLWLGVLATALAACGGSTGQRDAAAAGDASDVDGASDLETAEAAPLMLTCPSYCAAIMTTCTGSLQQYSDMDDCLNSCKAFPVGAEGDNLVDTLGCRVSHEAMAAASADDAKIHCVHAGPGGDTICGDNCSGYCDIVMMYCTEANHAKIYDTRAACLTDCGTRQRTVPYTTGDPGRTDVGNEIGCVLYHAQMASSVPVYHCLGDLAPAQGGLPAAGTCRPE